MINLRDKVVLVTGAGAGLGRSVALAFGEAGANVIAVSLDPRELAELEHDFGARDLGVLALTADVGCATDAKRVSHRVLEEMGRVDVLVNNAGVIDVKPLTETTVEDWDRLIATNLRGLFLFTAPFLRGMKERHEGVIINVSSKAGIRGRPNEVAYTTTKFGVEGFTRALAAELTPWNIHVMSVEPGVLIRTKMSAATYSPAQQQRWRDPAEIASAFLRLAQDGTGFSGKRINAWELAQTLVV